MPDLIALGDQNTGQWQKSLPKGETIRVGRAPSSGWAVPWDQYISREHFDIVWDGQAIQLTCVDEARAPIVTSGEKLRDVSLSVGEDFRVGKTRFRIAWPNSQTETDLLEEQVYSRISLGSYHFELAERRLELLSRLPSLIENVKDEDDFAEKLSSYLLSSIPRATAAAVLKCDNLEEEQLAINRMRWQNKNPESESFNPSRRLIKRAIECQGTVQYFWSRNSDSSILFTLNEDLDWAFCTPMQSLGCEGWAFYVAGDFELAEEVVREENFSIQSLFEDDVRFTELLAEFVGSIRHVQHLQQEQSKFCQFLSPTVVETLTREHQLTSSLLEPREGPVTVLFCDIKGFSRMSEASSNNLKGFLEQVSHVLNIMTDEIFYRKGAIEDFRGDSALGFWGWPYANEEGPLAACRAALAILSKVKRLKPAPSGETFRVGFGITHGQGVVGKIGADSQSKIGVFGPPVNLCSRLEGMTRRFGAEILMDEECADQVRNMIELGEGRLRKLIRVRPKGMKRVVTIYQLLPPEGDLCQTTDENLEHYQQALAAFQAGDWDQAHDQITLELPNDPAAQFLLNYLTQTPRSTLVDWDGVITLKN